MKTKSDLVGGMAAAELAGVSLSAIQKFARAGALPSELIANRRIYRRADVLSFARRYQLARRLIKTV